MSLTFELRDGALRFVTVGDVDYATGLAVLRAGFGAAADAGPGKRWGLVFDIRSSSEDRNPDELRGIAAVIAGHRQLLTGRCSVLATDPLHYGLARMFGVFLETLGLESAAFRNPADAEAWLTTPPVGSW